MTRRGTGRRRCRRRCGRTGRTGGRPSRCTSTATRWRGCSGSGGDTLVGRRRRGLSLPTGLLVAVCVLVGGCAAVLLPEGDLLRDVYLRGSPATPTVALTFDDGPNGRCPDAVADAPRDVGAHATLFVLGANVARAQDVAM